MFTFRNFVIMFQCCLAIPSVFYLKLLPGDLEFALDLLYTSEDTLQVMLRGFARIMATYSEEKSERVTYKFSRNSEQMNYTCKVNIPQLKKIIIAFFFFGKTLKTISKT